MTDFRTQSEEQLRTAHRPTTKVKQSQCVAVTGSTVHSPDYFSPYGSDGSCKMPVTVSEEQLCQSVLDFVVDGAYPSSEEIVAAEFPVSALSRQLESIAHAREQLEVRRLHHSLSQGFRTEKVLPIQKEIHALTEQTADDVDGWISQAKQLHADIERSRETAREIVAQHEKTKPLQLAVRDATAKVQLMQTELAFNEAVTGVLEEVQEFTGRLESGHKAVEEERIKDAIEILESVHSTLETAGFSRYGNLTSILRENTSTLRSSIVELLLLHWAAEVRIDRDKKELRISNGDGQCSRSLRYLDSTRCAYWPGKLLIKSSSPCHGLECWSRSTSLFSAIYSNRLSIMFSNL